jgi:hypothetical protein
MTTSRIGAVAVKRSIVGPRARSRWQFPCVASGSDRSKFGPARSNRNGTHSSVSTQASWASLSPTRSRHQTYGSRRRSTTSSGCSSCSSLKGSRSMEIDSIEPPQRHHFSTTWRWITAPEGGFGVIGTSCGLPAGARTERRGPLRQGSGGQPSREKRAKAGEPDFHQLEPDVELAKQAPGAPRSRIVAGLLLVCG